MGVERDSERASRLVAIVESSDDAILGQTLDGVITSWNAGAERIYGFAADEMIGRDGSEIIPPDRLAELGPIFDRLRSGERVNYFETRRRRKDGAVIDVSVCISPIRDRGGVVVGASTVGRDVTEQNREEAERRALEQELHRAERLDTLGQLAGGIAHDFNNLLAVILSYTGFVIEETEDRPAIRADAEQILTAAQRAARLTRNLLIFSRRDEIQLAELDLDAVIVDMTSLLRTSVGAQVQVRVGPAAESAAIVADRGQIEQVLLNLAVNARDAMPGGGTLTIGTSLAELTDEYARRHPGVSPGRYVELALTDTGTGLGAEVAARIFEPFFTTKPVGEGTGLGLSTVYGIVIQSGGSLTVDSAEGTGTTFRVYFPAVGVPALGTPPGAAPLLGPKPGRGAATILVVDDEPPVLAAASRILRRQGYATLEAGTCGEALALASSRDVQLLLTDSVMPGMSGPTLAERITELRPGISVLHMSGNSAGVLSLQASRDGESDFVRKPFTAQALLAKVRAALGTPPPA